MQAYTNNIQDQAGNALAAVSVLVQVGGVDAVIYSDDGITLQDNPLTTDSAGMFNFYAANGNYSVIPQDVDLDPVAVSLFDATPGGTFSVESLAITSSNPPANASAPGTPGQIEWDTQYFYICIAANTWQRSEHNTW